MPLRLNHILLLFPSVPPAEAEEFRLVLVSGAEDVINYRILGHWYENPT